MPALHLVLATSNNPWQPHSCVKEQSSCSAINSVFFSCLLPAALLAVCFCCPESLDVVQTWVKELQKTYALLKVTPILFDVNIPVDLQPVRSNSL